MSDFELEKEPLLRKARWYSDRNRTYKACLCYLKILQRNPDHSQCIKELSALYFDRGDFELAGLCLEYLVDQFPQNQDFVLKLGHTYMHLRQYYRAKLFFSRDLSWRQELNEERILSLSQCELNLGNPMGAIALLEGLIEENPMPFYFLLQAEILENLKMHSLVLCICKKGLKRDPYFEELLTIKARVHLLLGEVKEARNIYFKMIKNQLYLGEAQFDIEDAMNKPGLRDDLEDLLRYFEDPPQIEDF